MQVAKQVYYNGNMTKEDAIKRAGNQSNLARLLGISRGAISQWKTIPKGRLYQLMVLKPEWFKAV